MYILEKREHGGAEVGDEQRTCQILKKKTKKKREKIYSDM